MGLGSIIGTGIFVSIAIATQVAGNGIVIAIVVAALLGSGESSISIYWITKLYISKKNK
ncbi:MAG: hypothetical protein LC662_13415 [Rhodothermaceae bacterium]|nr:hypothetical protein [Rhodothermaceae bacterium]